MSDQVQLEKFQASGNTNNLIFGMIGIGLLTCLVGWLTSADRTWYAFLLNNMFFFGLGVGALFFLLTHNLASAGWNVVIRRIPEAFMSYFKVGIPLCLVILFGLSTIYPWTDHEMMHADHFLHHKTGYFSTVFFTVRLLVFFGVVYYFSKRLLDNSLRQDEYGGTQLTDQQKPLSALGLVLFAPLFTIFAIDMIKSLEPKWFSTIFGVYVFAGFIQTTIAVIVISLFFLRKAGYLQQVKPDHVHDLGKYLFGWSIFWAYIGVSQYLLIWYANLPEETFYYINREQGNWKYISLFLPFIKFLLPFLLLLPFKAKRCLPYLTAVSVIVVISEWIDLTWMIMPVLQPAGFSVAWQDFGMFIGFAGVFAFMVRRFWASHPMAPQKDPYAHESLHHHVI